MSFVGEAGVDEGGPSQELFSVAGRTLCEPSSGAFHCLASGFAWFPSQVRGRPARQPRGPGIWGACPQLKGSHGLLKNVLVFNQASSCEDTFFQIGTLCGMALYNRCMLPIPFPRALYKKLLGIVPTLEDLEELVPGTGRYEPGTARPLAGKLWARRVPWLGHAHGGLRGRIRGIHRSHVCHGGAAKSYRFLRWSLSRARKLLLNRGWHRKNKKPSPHGLGGVRLLLRMSLSLRCEYVVPNHFELQFGLEELSTQLLMLVFFLIY